MERNCSAGYLTWHWTVFLSGISIFPLAVWALYKQIQQQKRIKTPCILYISSIAFYATTIIFSFGLLLKKLVVCTTTIPSDIGLSIYSLGNSLNGISWGLQLIFLLIILFYRLYYAFKGSSYEMSKCTTRSFISILVICIILLMVQFLSVLVLPQNALTSALAVICLVLVFLGVVILSIFLSILFISKLYRVHHSSVAQKHSQNEKFVLIITKSTILATISISSTFVMLIVIIIVAAIKSSYQTKWMIYASFAVQDVITNFLCIMLATDFAKHYYLKLCGSLDGCCRQCCFQLNMGEKQMIRSPATELSAYVEATRSATITPTTSTVKTQQV